MNQPKVKYAEEVRRQMLLTSVPEETYCLKTQQHSPTRSGANVTCYRCGMFLGVAREAKLGSLLDY